MTDRTMTDYDISIVNSQSFVDVDDELLTDVVARTLSDENIAEASISVAIVDNETIHALNRKYLDHDEPTDVLSFPLGAEPEGGVVAPGLITIVDGEVIVSAEMALQVADKMLWSPRAELVLYLIHGTLHLCGYDDILDFERTIMRNREWAVSRHWSFMPDDPAFVGAPPLAGRHPQAGESGVNS